MEYCPALAYHLRLELDNIAKGTIKKIKEVAERPKNKREHTFRKDKPKTIKEIEAGVREFYQGWIDFSVINRRRWIRGIKDPEERRLYWEEKLACCAIVKNSIEEIRRLYWKKNLPLHIIARRFGVSPPLIRRTMLQNNILRPGTCSPTVQFLEN
ncbi:hypothetical protein ES703_118164 [subsurface metagenome]